MQYWLFKTEPNDYSFDDLVRDRKTVWDGVGNNTALMHMRNVKKGDSVFVYHTGKDKHIAGIASVVRGPYPDPELDDEKRAVVDIKAVKAVPNPVTLAAVKADPGFAEFHLVTISRLSAMPVKPAWWKKLCKMGGVSAT
ncbi:MAG: ubiquinol-cytochrome c reductase [Phycisphaerae bacterium]|nr:MAG: ubiquinol-cytochrome c reductase [Phycisphaerae bacterium]